MTSLQTEIFSLP